MKGHGPIVREAGQGRLERRFLGPVGAVEDAVDRGLAYTGHGPRPLHARLNDGRAGSDEDRSFVLRILRTTAS